jgi:FtsH-binding integral membrane protein
MLPVWFFIGVLLTAYGVVILFTALLEWSHPANVVLSQYHPGLWGGIILLLIGGFYVLRFRPRPPEEK